MAETIDAERAHASNEVATADVRADGPAAVAGAPADLRAMRLAGVGAAAGSPPWLASDRGTVTSVLGTIQRTAGNRAACQLLERHGAGAAAVAQRSADGSDGGASPGRSPVLDVIGRGGGSGLDDATRVAMEHRFGGADFRDVRVHTGETASRSAEAVGANAYTVGNDIIVRDGQLSPHTLAHELTHVQQQRAGPVDGTETGDGVRVSDPSDRFEQAAEQTAQRITASSSTSVPPAAPEAEGASSGAEAAGPAIQRLAKPPESTDVVPQSGRKPPGPGNDQVASFIRRWSATPGERMATASKSEGIDEVAADQGAAAGEESGDAARPGAPAAATGPAPARDAAAAEGGAGATGAPTGRGAATGGGPGAGPSPGVIEMEPLVVTAQAPTDGAASAGGTAPTGGPAPTLGQPAERTGPNGVIEMEPLVITATSPAPEGATAPAGGGPAPRAATGPNGTIEMEPMVITATPPAPTGGASPNGNQPEGRTNPNGTIEMEPLVITGRPPTAGASPNGQGPAPSRATSPNGTIEMEPLVITGRPRAPEAAQQPGVIELEPIVITGHPPAHRNANGGRRDNGGRGDAAGAAGDRAPRTGPRVIRPDGSSTQVRPDGSSTETRPDGSSTQTNPDGSSTHTSPDGSSTQTWPDGSSTQTWPDGSSTRTLPDGSSTRIRPDGSPAPAGGSAPAGGQPLGRTSMNRVIEMEPITITGRPPASQPGAAPSPKAPMSGAVSTGFKEKAKPPLKGGAGPKLPGGAPKPKAAGGGARRAGGGGGGGGAPKPVPLGDAALEQWRSASQGAVAATKPGDIGEAKDGPKKIEQKGKDLDTSRKAGQPDYGAEAKSKTPPMPAEAPKEQALDTGPADAAIDTLKKAGSKRLTDQTLEPIGTPPAYEGLNPSDYVPKNLKTSIESLEAELAKQDFKPGEKEKLTKQLEEAKAKVAEIEKTGGKGTPPPSPTVTDKGPASLEPPSPAQGEVLGDAIAKAMGRVNDTADNIVKRAVASLKGDQVPGLVSMSKDMGTEVRQELEKELRGIADAAGVTKEQLDAKIEAEKKTVQADTTKVEGELAGSTATATTYTEDWLKDTGEMIAGGAEDARKEQEAKEAALQGPPDTSAIEKKRDEYLKKVQDVGAMALAGYTSSLTKRETDLDQAGTTQKGAVKQAADTQAAAIRRHLATETDQDKVALAALPTTDWGRTRSAAVDTEVRKLKKAAKTEKEGFDAEVATTLDSAREKVRDWAAHQQGKERSWWDRLMDMITDWRSQSKANTDAWERQRNADSRDTMMADLDTLTKLREAQASGNQEAASKEYARLDADQKALAQEYFKGGMSSIEFVARSTMTRIGNRRAPELATKMEEKAIADWDWMPLGQLAKAKNPGFNPDALANKVKGGVAGWGTNESQVYAGLGGARTAVERAALAKCYQALFHVSMEEDVADDMGGHEMERAKALMEGKSAEADAATIKEAVEGMGTDEQAIRDALRGKTPEELDEIKAEYFKKYGTPLKADLADDMSGAELDNTLALSDGDVDKADAAELEDAMAGPGTDEAKLKKVYERIREEEEARAKKDGISPAELKQRILDHNARVSSKFGEKYGDLQAKLEDELLDGEKRPNPKMGEVADDGDLKVLDALQSGDPSKIDAAKAYAEHKSTYTSDDEIEKVVRNQRRTAELDVALEMKSERARLDALKASGDIDPKEYEKRSQELDAAAKDKDGIEKRTLAKAGQNMGALKSEYSKATDGRQSFDMLVKNETSGYSNDEITELVASGGKLSDAQELYYSVAGAGTDEDKIKEVLKGKTPAQVEEIRKEYKRLHPDSNLDDDILGDLSGREDLDVGHTLKYGDPDTFAEQLEAEKDPEKRKKLVEGMKQMLAERRDFEETGMIGSIFALGADPMNSADQLEEAVKRADMYNTALTKNEEDNRGKDPKDIKPDPLLTAAKANFEMTYGGAVEAQEQVRAQIDAYTDAVTQVGAAIAGIAVTVATLGAAGPVVAAVYGAAAAAAATMALKATLKGDAYSWEEAGVDLAVGTVDAAVSAATAGLGKGVMQALEKAVATQVAKEVAKEGAEKVTESVVKVWVKEAMEEAIENAIQAMPSAFVGAMLDDNTWKGDDPWGTIWSATGQAGAMGAGMAVGIKGAKDIGGAAIGKIKGAKAEPKAGAKVEPKVEPHEASPHGGSTAEPPPAHVDTPDPKPLELPPAADPAHATASAEKGELPNEAHGKDLTKGGKLPESATPDPKPEPHAPEKLPEKEPGGRATPTDESGTPKGATASGEPHAPIDAAEITEFPEGSVGQLPETHAKDPAANKEFFEKWHESDPSREVALLRNTETGEFVVVQGSTGGVDLGKENPRWAEELLSPEQRGKGNWIYEAHSHPIEAGTKVTPEHARWPSGGGEGDDFNGLVKESARTGQPVKEEIRYVGEKGPETLTYGYDPKAEKPYFVERPGPDGTPVRHEYATIDEYHAAYEKEFGREPGRPIADDFQGTREPIDYEAPTLKPGELEAKGVGSGATDPSAVKAPDADAKPVGEVKPEPAKRGSPGPEDVGKPLTADDLKTRYGMPEANVAKISDVCAAEGIIVDIRPTTPHAEAMLREGTALPKPEKVKAKTINETDVQIGLGKKEDLGKVGFYDPAKVEPRRPADFDSLPKETQDRIDKRIKQRKEEFADFKKDMQKLQDAGLIRIEPDGTVINTGLIPGGEKPFTGDHDIFDIRAKDGSRLTAEQYQKAKAALLAADAGVMHGGVTGWEVDSPSTFNTEAGQKSYNKMVSEHSPGGDQPLVRLGDGEPKAVWYEPAQPAGAGPRENTPGGRNVPADRGEAGGSRAGKEPNPADLEKIRQIAESDPDAFTVNETGSEVRPWDQPAPRETVGGGSGERVAGGPGAGAPGGEGTVRPGGGPGAPLPGPSSVDTRIGPVDLDRMRSLDRVGADQIVIDQPGPGQPRRPPAAPPNSVIKFDEDTHLVFDAQGNLELKVTRASVEDVATGRRANTPPELADALGIERRVEPPPPRETNIAHSTLAEPAHVVEGRIGDPDVRAEAPNYQNKYPPGSEVTYNGQPVQGYERAHMWGPGFGNESILGIMLAPESTNQVLQNQGIEKVIRDLHKTIAPDGHIDVQVTARPHPGGRLETGEFLASVEYKVTATLPDGRVIRFEGGWDIDLPPAGTPHSREILGDPDAHKVLSGAKEDLAALAQARQAAGIDREPRF